MSKWAISLTVNVIATMAIIYLIKKASKKYDIPVLKQITEEV